MTLSPDAAPGSFEWAHRLQIAQEMLPLITRLHQERNVVVSIFGRILVGATDIDIIKSHRYARRITSRELPLEQTLPILHELTRMDVGTASIDLGRLAAGFAKTPGAELKAYLEEELAEVIGQPTRRDTHTDVVLYGFGRIGRLLARILIGRGEVYGGVRLRAVVVRKKGADDLAKRASLLRRDSVHGGFHGTISVDEEAAIIRANGTDIQFIYADDPTTIDYTTYGIRDAIVVDNTGRWRDRAGLEQHLQAKGVSRVVLTAPGKGDLPNIVYGINQEDIAAQPIVSAASCTTNAITPVLKVIGDRYGVRHGHVETVHSFTNDQNLIDNFHGGDRRGRAAGLNMVLTSTGAAKAVAKALPEFAGKLTGNAIRVPTPDVSMAVLNLELEREVERDEVNTFLRKVSLHSHLRQQIDYIASPEVVSTDFVGWSRTGIVDGLATIADGRHLVLYVWYDNEFGYSNQVIRVIEEIAGVRQRVLPARLDPRDMD